MVRLWLVIGCSAMLWMFGTIAPAQTSAPVIVRSGDHDGFSRLVLDLPRRLKWTLLSDGQVRVLNLAGTNWTFDISSVFTRMQNQRIVAIANTEGGDGLRINLGCTCEVEVFWHGAAMLVVDVRDARPRPNNPVVPGATKAPALSETLGQIASTMAAATLAPLLSEEVLEDETSEDGKMSERGEERAEKGPDLGPVRLQLSRHLARAASMGLLTAQDAPWPTSNALAASAERATDASVPEKATTDRSGSATHSQRQIRAETSIGADILPSLADNIIAETGTVCLADTALAVESWADGGRFADQIGPARARLSGEFDRFVPSAGIALARLYLHYGFGAEADQVLRATGVEGEPAEIAAALARIMDGEDAEGSRLAGQLSCDSTAAFWSALSYSRLPAGAPTDDNAILRTTNGLPPHLREYLAPQLARKFTAADRPEMAERILRLLERDDETASPAHSLARAEVELSADRVDDADHRLADVVAANSQSSAVALLRQIDARLRDGRMIPHDMADLAGAYAQEQGDNPVGHELTRAYIEASAATGAFHRAFADMARLTPTVPEDIRRRMTDKVMALLADNADDLTFLRYAMHVRAFSVAELAASAGNAVAARLIGLGFADVAQAYVGTDVQGVDQRDRQLLRAKAALALRKPRQAQVALLGLIGEDVNRLRARAQSMVGAYRAAHLLYISGGEDDAARLAAMQAEDWGQVAALGDEDVASLANVPDSMPDEAGSVLARNRKLLAASEAVRASVSGLLTTRPVAHEVAN
ncbi:hypothetical protein [Roseovarius pelagicus]|uniref:Uncharacterized protein n=1 Tax=Roseovarius pelagicus TaxID=2980108 RepID=A0ABY6D816_9RHOB|nr:hypothetical protein [Roseovarius pelagicus]UXX82276.1 hypothetical protein N7U68_14360 [Roseovarius pelagicus]